MTETVTPPVAPPPAQPPVDVAAIAAKAAEGAIAEAGRVAQTEAARIAGNKLAEIGRSLLGQEKPNPSMQVLESFVNNPVGFAHTIKEVAKNEIRNEMQANQSHANTQRAVMAPILSEYPELNSPNKIALVEKLTEKYQREEGKSYSEALELGAKATVKEFGLTSVSDAQRTGAARFTGLPGGGGTLPAGTQRHNEAKSQADFLSGMKAAANGVRNKRA